MNDSSSSLNNSSQISQKIEHSANLIQKWVEDRKYKGVEPFDGLSSWFRPLTFGNLFAERVLQQIVRQSPINLRPIMGVKPKESTKGRGYMAWGYLFRHKTTGNKEYLQKAELCLDWLDKNKCEGFDSHCWSNQFDFSARGGHYSKTTPIIVWTSSIGQTYLEAFEQTGNERWLDIAKNICKWILEVPREKTEQGTCLSYFADRQLSIHNASMLGAAMLSRAYKHTGTEEYREVAQSAMLYSCSRQEVDGAWRYGVADHYAWNDNFHTGYNLDALKTYIDHTGDETWRPNLQKGLEFFKAHFFEENGCPKYYHDRTYPIDSQCAGQAIETLARHSEEDPSCLPLACKVAEWVIDNMQEADGHIQYRHYPWGKAKTGMLHWGQAVNYKGMAILLHKLSAAPSN